MPNPKKFTDFIESGPVSRKRNHYPYTECDHILLKCPRCDDEFAAIPQDSFASNRTARIKSHLAKCPAYECSSCDEDAPPAPKSTALVAHDQCIAERNVLKQEKSSLEEKLDAMTQQLSASREEAKREREEARQSQNNLTSAINGVKSQLDRWEGGLVSAMECEFKLVRPITAETIPIQMRSRESQLALKYSKSDEVEAVNRERMLTQLSTKDKQLSNLQVQNARLQGENDGLRSNLKSLDNKLKDALAEKETMVTRAVMKEKVMRAETESKRKYVDLKKQSIVIHNEQNAVIEKLKAENAKLKSALRKRPVPGTDAETKALSKRPMLGNPKSQV